MKLFTLLQSASRFLQYPDLLQLRLQGVSSSQYLRYGQRWMRDIAPLSILDIGANAGQSTIAFHALYPNAKIYAFEPIPECYEQLKLLSLKIPNLKTFNMAVGDSIGELSFEKNEFTASSSFLPLASTHKQLFSYAKETKEIAVQINKLDNIFSGTNFDGPILIKIDVQGFEDQVLRGGETLVKNSHILIIETSFKTLYDGQPLFKDIYQLLHSWGFEYRGSAEDMYHPISHEIIQSDSIFVKSE